MEGWEEKQGLPIDWLDVTTAIKTRTRTKYYSKSRETLEKEIIYDQTERF